MLDQTRLNIRPVATPLPITFLGLMIATVVVSGYELGAIPKSDYHEVGWVVLAVPVPMQLLAAAWGFVTRSVAATTGSAVLAATWLGVGLSTITSPRGAPGPDAALGLMLLAAAAALLVPVLAETSEGGLLPAAVLLTASVRFCVAGVDGVTHSHAWTVASGYTGFVLAGVALYGALALELESAQQEPVLPTFRVGDARRALEQPFDEQVTAAEQEPGVRQTL
ncbi:MAG: hypothetical protein ACRDLK_08845 [Gaiellaceae bacterium]